MLDQDSTILPLLSSALLSQQLPPTGKFGGDNPDDGETFEEWIGRLEMVASISCWDDCTKFVNLASRLRGQVYAFYRSCTPQKRGDYNTLVAELTTRFTPVRLQVVQSSLFHDWKQRQNEPVDIYAQELRRFFYLAYPRAQQSSQEAEDMGNSVLAYQFFAGLQQKLKVKVAGVDGTFDELWTKARFEEAKIRDLGLKSNAGRKPNPPPPPPQKDGDKPPTEGAGPKSIRCYHCHGTGHIAKNCPLRGRGTPDESARRNAKGKGGQWKGLRVGNVCANEETRPKTKSEVVAKNFQ